MTLNLVDFERKARSAVESFWKNREAAKIKQIESGNTDHGERAGVTAGKNMDGFLALMLDVVKNNGLKNTEIHQGRTLLTLPGYFRPTKLWDLLVVHNGALVAAIELKATSALPSATISTTEPKKPSAARATSGQRFGKGLSANSLGRSSAG